MTQPNFGTCPTGVKSVEYSAVLQIDKFMKLFGGDFELSSGDPSMYQNTFLNF